MTHNSDIGHIGLFVPLDNHGCRRGRGCRGGGTDRMFGGVMQRDAE
jgi:hypothetical protein